MSKQTTQNPTLEIGHVLLASILDYSRLSSADREQALQKLRQAIQQSKEFSQTRGDVVQLPTEDGEALVFSGDIAAPLRCALEVASKLKLGSDLRLRIGIHSGPVYRIANANANIESQLSGEGIDYAEHVMHCGDAGHILVSKDVADVLRHSEELRNSLHELGVTHDEDGVRVHLFNCYTDEVGNPQPPEKFLPHAQGDTEFAGPIDGRYQVLSKLGEGGMGLVYEAEDKLLGRRVAIKLLTPTHDSEDYRSRFYREARAASKLTHRHIAVIYDYGNTPDGRQFIVMELVRGKSLATLLEGGALEIDRAIEIVADVASALGEAHRRGVIHRDIKPGNVVVSSEGEVKVLDFGLAKEFQPLDLAGNIQEQITQTRSGTVVGTPLYLSPEQAKGIPLDPRTDLFSLGSLLYECLTGRAPFASKSVMEIRSLIIHFNPVAPSKLNPAVPEQLDQVTAKALAKDPAHRYQSAEEMITALRGVEAELTTQGNAPTQLLEPSAVSTGAHVDRYLAQLKNHAGHLVLIAAALLVTAVAVWAGVRYWHKSVVNRERAVAQDLYDRGTRNLRDGTYFQASKMLEEAVKNAPSFALAHARLAEAYMELDVTDKAQQEMLSAEDGRKDLTELEQLHLSAINATVRRDFPRAVFSYSELQRRNPDQPGIYVDLGRAYEKNFEFDKAIESYQKAIDRNPQEAAAFQRLGTLTGQKREKSKALAAFDKANAIYDVGSSNEGRAEVFFQRGSFFNLISEFDEALRNLKEAQSLVQDNKYQRVRVLLQMSLTACFSNKPDESQKLATEALNVARENTFGVLTAQSLIGLGNSQFCSGQFADAEKNFREALALAQRYEARGSIARARLSLASLQIHQGKTDEGLRNVQEAQQFYGGDGSYVLQSVNAQNLIGRALRSKSDYSAASQALQAALGRAVEFSDFDNAGLAHEGLGGVMLDQGRYPEALSHYQEAIKAFEQTKYQPGIGFNLSQSGSAHWHLGQYQEADKAFDRALVIAKTYKNLLIEIQVNRLEGALSRREFAAVVKLADSVRKMIDVDSGEPAIRAKLALAVARLNTGKVADARKLCDEATAKAVDMGDPALIYSARLTLAEVLLKTQQAAEAREIVSSNLNFLVSSGQQDSLWRSYLLAARASQQLGDTAGARNYSIKAREVLDRIQHDWGPGFYQTYVERPDVRELLSYLETLET